MKYIKKVSSESEAKALMYFLAKEEQRHIKDARQCRRDMVQLTVSWGIKPPTDIDPDEWVEP